MEYDGSKLKVKIDKDDEDRCTFQVLEMPEEWRGVNYDGENIFVASNGWKIASIQMPGITNGIIYLRGDYSNSDYYPELFYIIKLDRIVTALREFGATIIGNAVCDNHEWVTVYEGDPTYEGTFCKNCREKQDGV